MKKGSEDMRALIFLNDSPTALLNKGEVLERYFNPNEIFQKLDFVLSVKAEKDYEALSQMSGNAEIRIYYLNNASPFFVWSLGWSKYRLAGVASSIRNSSWFVKPDVIRSVSPFVEAGVATALSEQTGVPMVVSVHGTHDRDPIRPGNFIDILMNPFRQKLFHWVLSSAAQVVGVYEDASNFARRMGARAPITIYNELGVSSEVAVTKRYLLGEIVRVGCINRQDLMKDPRNIIKAIVQYPQIHLTLVGDGPIHAEIENLISDLHLSDRIECIKAMPNRDWLQTLASMDLYVSHCDYAGISKGVLEAALLGVPIVINRNDPIAPEYLKGWVYLCDDSVEGYAKGIGDLLADTDRIRRLGHAAREFADAHCATSQVRNQWQDLYLKLLK